MKIIRASEIGTYQFCHRAWWYQLQGYEPENNAELIGGSEYHEKHGRELMVNHFLQVLAYGSILLAIITGTAWIIQSFR